MYKYKRKFTIASINILVESNIFFSVSDKYVNFENNFENTDVYILVDDINNISIDDNKEIYISKYISIYSNGHYTIKVKHNEDDYNKADWCLFNEDDRKFILYVTDEHKKNLRTFNLLHYLDISSLLINQNSVMLHSSIINYKNNGIIFTAPSGTGKSTQADLWHEYLGAIILNGDRSIIKKCGDSNEYLVFGSPYAGSSGIYLNQSVPLKAIIVLRQGKTNRLYKLNKKQAYLCLISEMAVSNYNTEVVKKETDWLLKLLNTIPIFMFEALPYKESVDFLLKGLGGIIYDKN